MDLDPAGFHLEIWRKSREPETTAHLEPDKAFHLPAVWRAVFGPIGQWDLLFYESRRVRYFDHTVQRILIF